MKGIPKILKTKEDYYNCLAMVTSGDLPASSLLQKIESVESQFYMHCKILDSSNKTITIMYNGDLDVGMQFKMGDVSGTIQSIKHTKNKEKNIYGDMSNDRTVLTLSKSIPQSFTTISIEIPQTTNITKDDINALKGVLKRYE